MIKLVLYVTDPSQICVVLSYDIGCDNPLVGILVCSMVVGVLNNCRPSIDVSVVICDIGDDNILLVK